MKIVIVGAGKVGTTLCEQLSAEGHDIVIIDQNPATLYAINNRLDVMSIEGNGTLISVQEEAETNKADLFISCASTDETNMLCCVIAKKLGAKKTAARVRNPEYYSQFDFIQNDLKIDIAINPELAAAEEITRVLAFPSALKVEPFARGRVELVEYKIEDSSALCGTKLQDINKLYNVKILICAVQRSNEIFIPKGNFTLLAGDKIHISAPHTDIKRFVKLDGGIKEKIKSTLIIGGGRVSYYVAKKLTAIGLKVKIIENDPEQCMTLTKLLPEVTIINADGTDHHLLKEEGIEMSDSVVTLTNIDEENIVTSIYAKKCDVTKVITKINRGSYIEIASSLGLDTIVSPKLVSSNRMVAYARGMSNSQGSNVETVYRMFGNKVEALEFIAPESAPYLNKPLRELKMRPNTLIAAIVRGRRSIIPYGDTEINKRDNVIVVTSETLLDDLKDAFEI